jgi:2-phospho-L-lactate/phosphoenolpyruvate guanylyltransferase
VRGDNIWAVVPAKDLADAKSRLAPVLSTPQRQGLALAMLEDVLTALSDAPVLAGIVVVTREPELASCARSSGARVVTDLRQAGPNAAITLASAQLASDGASGMIAIPADIPLLTPAAVAQILEAMTPEPSVTLIPALADMGTNAVALAPLDVIPPCFGPQSFFRHQEAALARGLAPRILHLPEIGFDLDRPEDLAAFLSAPSRTSSFRYLSECGIAARLAAVPRLRAQD